MFKKSCKHKNVDIVNEEIGGYNIPEGCVTEYDLYCKDCKKIVAHWAYGSFDDPMYVIKYQMKGIKKVKAWIKYNIVERIKYYFMNRKVNKLMNKDSDLPF